ncbi:hypothetical protein QOT17_014841 [Balamuthia mandrillaris]
MQQHHQVCVAYEDPDGQWEKVSPHLQSLFPLQNVKWSTDGVKQKTCKKLELVFAPQDKFSNPPLPVQKFQWPYAYLYIAYCKDSDTYNKALRGKIRAWVNHMEERQQEYLLVMLYVGRQSVRTEVARKLNRSSYDKMRSDFNNAKRDRCCELRIPDTQQSPVVGNQDKSREAMEDFVEKLKTCISITLSQHVTFYRDQVQKLYEQRSLPGWNYCNYFVTKEALAFLYERAGSIEKALRFYNELGMLFVEVNSAKQKALPGNIYAAIMDKFGAHLHEDNISVLDTHSQPYREMILQNSITEFQFRKYLFARQAELLFALQRPWEVAKNALPFIQQLAKDIATHQTSLGEEFRLSWVFSACMCVLHACEHAAQSVKKKEYLYSPLGELCSYARSKLERLGQTRGLLHSQINILPNGKVSIMWVDAEDNQREKQKDKEKSRVEDDEENNNTEMEDQITNATLLDALKSVERFDHFYLDLSGKEATFYKDANRLRWQARVEEQIADLHFIRGRHEDAVPIYEKVGLFYGGSGWHLLSIFVRAKLAICYDNLALHHYFVECCLALCKAIVKTMPSPGSSDHGLACYSLQRVLECTKDNLSKEVIFQMGSLLKTTITASHLETQTTTFQQGQIMTLNCHFSSSLLSEEYAFDELGVVFIPSDASEYQEDHLTLTASTGPIALGGSKDNASSIKLDLPLKCEAGSYRCTKVFLRSNQLTLDISWRFLQLNNSNTLSINVLPSNPSFAIQFLQETCLLLEHTQFCRLDVHTHSDQLTAASLYVSSPSNLQLFPSSSSSSVAAEDDDPATSTKNTSTCTFLRVDANQEDKETNGNKSKLSSSLGKRQTEHLTATETKPGRWRMGLPSLAPHQRLQLLIPVVATPVKHNAPQTYFHRLLARVEYEVEAKTGFVAQDRKVAKASGAFQFVHPFAAKHFGSSYSNRQNQQKLLQVALMCQVPSLRILRYQLSPPPNYVCSFDTNPLLLEKVIYSQQEVSLVFELLRKKEEHETNEEAEKKSEGKLCVWYQPLKGEQQQQQLQNGELGDTPEYKFVLPLSIASSSNCSHEASYSVRASCERDHTTVGNMLAMTVLVKASDQQQNHPRCQHLQYEVLADSRWIVVGSKKHSFPLEGSEKRFTIKLLPLTCGSLPTPTIVVREEGKSAGEQKTVHRPSVPLIQVYPQRSLSCYLQQSTP